LQAAQQALADSNQTPSARVLADMAADWDNSYQQFALDMSRRHRAAMRSPAPDPALLAQYTALAEASIRDQKAIEDSDTIEFEQWRQQYITQDLSCG
jgi:glutamate--cysteine ligase